MLRFHSWSTIEKYGIQAKPSEIEIRKIIVGHVQIHGTQNKRHYLTTTVRYLCFIRFEYTLCNGNKRELNMIIENLHFVCVFFFRSSPLFLSSFVCSFRKDDKLTKMANINHIFYRLRSKTQPFMTT